MTRGFGRSITLPRAAALAALALLCVPAAASEPEDPLARLKCAFSSSRRVAFTGARAPETLTVSVEGTDCRKAEYRVVVRSEGGATLYRYVHPWFDMSVFARRDAPEMTEKATRAIERVFDALERPVTEGRELRPVGEADGMILDCRFVDLERYEALRAQRLPYLCHATWYEGFVCLVYDRKAARFVAVSGSPDSQSMVEAGASGAGGRR
jgi:hypothetical protein